MIRVRLEVPAEGDETVLAALRAVCAQLKAEVKQSDIAESASAPPDSYGLTVHVFADKEE